MLETLVLLWILSKMPDAVLDFFKFAGTLLIGLTTLALIVIVPIFGLGTLTYLFVTKPLYGYIGTALVALGLYLMFRKKKPVAQKTIPEVVVEETIPEVVVEETIVTKENIMLWQSNNPVEEKRKHVKDIVLLNTYITDQLDKAIDLYKSNNASRAEVRKVILPLIAFEYNLSLQEHLTNLLENEIITFDEAKEFVLNECSNHPYYAEGSFKKFLTDSEREHFKKLEVQRQRNSIGLS